MSSPASRVAETMQSAPQFSPGLSLTKERVSAVVDDLPEEFSLDELVDALIYLAELDERTEAADHEETIPHKELIANAREHLKSMRP